MEARPPTAAELPDRADLPVLGDVIEPASIPAFSAEEASRINLLQEAQVDWNGKVDIDLSAEPEVAPAEMAIGGLPAPDPADAVEPVKGAELADHVQLGFAYRMHLQGEWHKVKLSFVSPGRNFFVFTRGARDLQSLSLTRRMLVRMCEGGRLRAFENAYLIERATARARRQLSALAQAQ